MRAQLRYLTHLPLPPHLTGQREQKLMIPVIIQLSLMLYWLQQTPRNLLQIHLRLNLACVLYYRQKKLEKQPLIDSDRYGPQIRISPIFNQSLMKMNPLGLLYMHLLALANL